MRFGLLLLAAAVAGSVARVVPQRPDGQSSTMPDGTWSGTLDWKIGPDGSKVAGDAMAVASCQGKVRMWWRQENGSWDSVDAPLTVRSGPDSHTVHLSHMDTSERGWVEHQTLTLLEITDQSAKVQWSRAVNNRGYKMEQDGRTFFNYGAGTFRRTRIGCNAPLLSRS